MEFERTRVDIEACAKTYADGTRGLQPTSLAIAPGEVLALLGPSGCGKTTCCASLPAWNRRTLEAA